MKLTAIIISSLLALKAVQLLSETGWWKENLDVIKDKLETMKYKFHLN